MNIRTVTIIGATGSMGSNVAGIFASFGDARVFCTARDIEKVKSIIPKIIKSVKADVIADNLIPADFQMLEECVRQSDLVFESCAEDISLKNEIAERVGAVLPENAVSCTGTSGLSVTEIAKNYPENARKRFFGVHLFNPPYSMSLCELISTEYSDCCIKNELKEYLGTVLLRTVVEAKDSPAFLANRIGFQFINEAMIYAEKFRDNGGVDYIDAILGPFTGRAMAPLVTSDFVGLDVHKAIVDNLFKNTSDYSNSSFVLPKYVCNLIAYNKLGQKTGGGFYRLSADEEGRKIQTVYDINTGLYRETFPYVFPFSDKMKSYIFEGDYSGAFEELINNKSQEAEICLEFLLKYIVYSLYCAEQSAYSADAADDVMTHGFNWCPPIALFKALSEVVDVVSLIKDRLPSICAQIDVPGLLGRVKPSKYDYRRFFRSGR